METIVKILKAFFIGPDGEVETSTIDKVRKAILWIILGAGITFGGLLYWADDEDTTDNSYEVEEVEK